MSNLTAEAVDPTEIMRQLMEAACLLLNFTGPLELRYRVSDTCTISVSLKKE